MQDMKARRHTYFWKRMVRPPIWNRRIMKYQRPGNTGRISAEEKIWPMILKQMNIPVPTEENLRRNMTGAAKTEMDTSVLLRFMNVKAVRVVLIKKDASMATTVRRPWRNGTNAWMFPKSWSRKGRKRWTGLQRNTVHSCAWTGAYRLRAVSP